MPIGLLFLLIIWLLFRRKQKTGQAQAQAATVPDVVKKGNETGHYEYPWQDLQTTKPNWLQKLEFTFDAAAKTAVVYVTATGPVLVKIAPLVPLEDPRRIGYPFNVLTQPPAANGTYNVTLKPSVIDGGGMAPETEYEVQIQLAGLSSDTAFVTKFKTPTNSTTERLTV